MLPLKQFKRLDVRPLLAKGLEPYPAIREGVQKLKPNQGLIVIAPFLPTPLIERLGAEDFRSKIERGAKNEWIVYFWREHSTPDPGT